MHPELRILNGLHRGGILPLDDTTLLIGADEDADVVLVDPGICDHHASLQATDDGWMLTADAGPVFSSEQASAQMLLDLQEGEFFRLGETWLVISDHDAPWQSIPQPVMQSNNNGVFNDASDDRTDDDDAALDAEDAFAAAVMQTDAADPATDAVTEAAPDAITDGVAEEVSAGPDVARRFQLPRWRGWMIAPASLFALLGAVAAYAYTAKPSLPKLLHPDMPLAWHTEKSSDAIPSTDNTDAPAASASLSLKSARTSASVPIDAAAQPSPQLLQAAFRKRMKDADLLQRFDLDLNETAWSMRAHLDDEESARFERILKAFVVEHKITFPISAKVGSAESMLPFQIRQIVTGVNAGIVTGDGDRVYVGDELLGVKLVAVVDNHLTFMGKRKIEVIW